MPTKRGMLAAVLAVAILNPSVSSAGQSVGVSFDAPAIVLAEPVNPEVVAAPLMGGQLLRLRLAVSSRTAPDFNGQVNELIVEIENPQRSMRIVDYWPKKEVYSDVEGTIAVEQQRHKNHNFAFQVSGAYEPFARGQATGDFHNQQSVNERYSRKAPVRLLTSSGTLDRGYGVFYKFHSGPLPVSDGGHEVALLVEVPATWRADLLQVNLRAVGKASSSSQSSRADELAQARLWSVVHRADDAPAATYAARYVAGERRLRALAAHYHKQVDNRAYPTVFHRVGAALDVVDPKIPSDYLTQVLFGSHTAYFTEATNRLPVDLRVAILDYWDQRRELLKLSTPPQTVVRANGNGELATASRRISDWN